jgi:hypothetical protein
MADRKKAAAARRRAQALDMVPSAPQGPLPDFSSPQLATLVDKAPAGENWLHEIKLDGYRTAARIESAKIRMLTRRGLDWTARFAPNRNGQLFFSGRVGTGFGLRVGRSLKARLLKHSRSDGDHLASFLPTSWRAPPTALLTS